jgi:hypothetical protein
MFESAEPVSGTEVRRRRVLEPKLEAARKYSAALFVVGLIPCLAPVGAVVGSIWFFQNRDLIRKLPGQNRVFCYVGLLASVVCTVAILMVLLLV